MRRRNFLTSMVAPMAPELRSGSQWIFRRYPGRFGEADPLRRLWRKLCPISHRWFVAVAAESMPQTAVLAGFSSLEASREVAPDIGEVFEGLPGGLAGCGILELRERIGSPLPFRGPALQNSRYTLVGFESFAKRWEIRDKELGRLALFKAERG